VKTAWICRYCSFIRPIDASRTSLPTSKAGERVQMWRKLQRFGSIPFRNAGSLLPNTPANQERFEWVATAIRASKREASILQI
jgi:RIO-like serine/threonine protein kinase